MDKKSAGWVKYSGTGVQLFITILLCWWIGEKLELYVDLIPTPFGQLGGLLLGVFAGMYNLIRSLKI